MNFIKATYKFKAYPKALYSEVSNLNIIKPLSIIVSHLKRNYENLANLEPV